MGYAKIYIEKQVTYILRKLNGDDVTRVIHCQKNRSLPPKKGTKIYVTTRDHNKNTGHVTLWNKRGHILCHWKAVHSKPDQLTFWNKTGLCVTRRVHINNKANSHSEKREATLPSEECTLETRPTHTLKQSMPPSVTRRVHINQANLPSEARQATVSVTKRLHIRNRANSPTETRQVSVCHQKSEN